MITSKHILGFGLASTLAAAAPASADVLAYWNFNTSSGDLYNWDASFGSGTISLDPGWTNLTLAAGSNLNAQFGDPAGDAMNLKGDSNNGRAMDFTVDTTGYESIVFAFDSLRNNSGYSGNQVWYSIDGVDYSLFSTFGPPNTYSTMQFDMSSVAEINDAGQVYLRIRFNGATNNGGMNRLDNATITGTALPAPGTLALLGVALAITRRRRRF